MATTSTNPDPKPAPSLDEMLAAVNRLLHELGPEPIAAWMRSIGFDPDDGCAMVLPSSMAHMAGSMPPRYVLVSTLVLEPVLIRDAFPPKLPDLPNFDTVLRDQYGWNFSIAD